jgi:rubrerythrin
MRDKDLRKHPTRAAPTAPLAGEPDTGPCGGNRARPRQVKWALAALAVIAMGAGYAAAEDGVTLAALRIAYDRECNTRADYGAYALRAEADGMPVAALAFRVAAIAESVHATLQAQRIRDFGVEPVWTLQSIVVHATEENLRTAIENEAHEYACVYPQLIDQSRPECLYDALAPLQYARAAEATHANLFTEVLQNLEPIETPRMLAAAIERFVNFGGEGINGFYVCMGDGSVFTHPIQGSCPNCGSGKASFRLVTIGDVGVKTAMLPR